MELIIRGLTLLLIIYVINLFKVRTEYNYDFNTDDPYIRMNRGYLYLGIGMSAVAMILSIVFYFASNDVMSIACFIFVFPGALFIAAYYGYIIKYDNEKIEYSYFFEKPHVIYYKDVIDVQIGLDTVIKTKSKKLVIPSYMTNCVALLWTMSPYTKRLKKRKKKNIPKVRPFGESIERPRDFMIAFGMFLSFTAGVAIAILVTDFSLKNLSYMLGLNFCSFGFVFLIIHSVKRAHSSAFWRKVAMCIVGELNLRK